MMQTVPMEIDDGVESYCHRCHLVYHGTKEKHQPECDEHGYCMITNDWRDHDMDTLDVILQCGSQYLVP